MVIRRGEFSPAGLLAVGMLFLSASPAHAWYGPFCYSSKARQVTLTVPTITGETPGDLKVTFDDNDGKARLVSVRASTKVKNAHEIVLARDEDSRSGIFAVQVTSPRSAYGLKFELEFRDDAADCTGAIIKVSDKFSNDPGSPDSDTPVHVAKTRVKKAQKKAVEPTPEDAAAAAESAAVSEHGDASSAMKSNGESSSSDSAKAAPTGVSPAGSPESASAKEDVGQKSEAGSDSDAATGAKAKSDAAGATTAPQSAPAPGAVKSETAPAAHSEEAPASPVTESHSNAPANAPAKAPAKAPANAPANAPAKAPAKAPAATSATDASPTSSDGEAGPSTARPAEATPESAAPVSRDDSADALE